MIEVLKNGGDARLAQMRITETRRALELLYAEHREMVQVHGFRMC
jgi:hypothetical protein